jgi:alginate O-acetyltransferase complex protein AlgJ
MTQLAARVCASVFLGIVFLPGVLGVLGVEGRAIENRSLTEFPKIGPSSLVDQDFYAAMSGFLTDHLPLRDLLVRANSLISLNVWKDSPNPDVHVGREDWLFTTAFQSSCPDRMPLDVVDQLAALGRGLAASGREMRLVLPPDKATLYPEFLGAFPPSSFTCGLERLAALRHQLSQVPEIGFIDMWSWLGRLKKDGEEPLYFPGDSHWTLRSAAEASRAIVESIEPGLWREADVHERTRISLPMDLALMVGVSRSVPVSVLETRRDGVLTKVVERIDCERGPSCVARYVSSGSRQLIRQRTLLVRDSFGTMSIDTLVPYFEDITFLFWSDDVHDQLTHRVVNADLVVYETLDQFLFTRVGGGFTKLAIPPRARESRP